MNEYHRVYAQISTRNIRHNLLNIKNKLSPGTKLMPVIKADAYGHGSLRAAKALGDISDFFAVATIEEAVELRQGGVDDTPILILGALSANSFSEALKWNISVNVFTEEAAYKLSELACSMNVKARVHVSVDTGMNRVGLLTNDTGKNIFKKIYSCPGINVEGVFSHFATADEENKEGANLQLKKFNDFCKYMEAEGINVPYRHIFNSAACCDFEGAGNIVRPGIVLYGYYPSDEVNKNLDLKWALSLKTHVSHIKKVPAGEGIGYGHTYVTKTERLIATVPVGYADGYPRLLSNKGRVIVRGCYAPIVGRICMDQFMIDVTDIEGVCVEDTVTLIGADGDCSIGADEIAQICGTISYEVLCGISKRVPRVYPEM